MHHSHNITKVAVPHVKKISWNKRERFSPSCFADSTADENFCMLSICETVVHCEKNATRLDDNTDSEELLFLENV